jgi:TonB-dependent starch-binding outer membrane protein SusC
MKKILIYLKNALFGKPFKTMKISFFLVFACAFQVLAVNNYAQDKELTLYMEDATIAEALQEIEDQSDFKFFYNDQTVDLNTVVSLDVTKDDIWTVLDQVLPQSDITYYVKGKQIALFNNTNAEDENSMQQAPSISGTVSDVGGSPIPGVTVYEKGTNNGTITNGAGEFKLQNITSESVLVFSFIGMKTIEVAIGDQSTMEIIMEQDAIGLEEVVTVGYATQRKVNLTGSISTVKFDEKIENRPITNASQALGGSVTGVWVSQNSGKPGDDGAQIRVRGWGTMNNSNPLVIIDGVEGSFDQINPSDIESLAVLKDAASAAIYGSKAANGVILVTTKMGKNNEKMQVNLTSYVGVQSLGKRYDLVTNSAESMRMTNTALSNEGSSPLFPDYLITAFENGGDDPYKYPNTDWYSELFQPAVIHEHNLSIRGGTESTSSFLSFNYLSHDGMVANTNSKRYGIRANLESDVNKWLTVGGRFNYMSRKSEEPYADYLYGSLGRVFEMMGGATPYTAPYTRDGEFGSVQAYDNTGALLYDNRNPLIDAANGLTATEQHFVTVNAFAEVKFSEALSFKTTVASTGDWRIVDKHNTSVYGYTDTGVQTITKNYNREGLEINRSHISNISNNVFATLNYKKTFGGIHNFSAIGGVQVEDRIIKNVYGRRTEPPKEGLTQVNAGTSGIVAEGDMIGVKIFSYFGRMNYNIADKYLFEFNLRADASSRFEESNRWGVFPGFSAGWRVIQEDFMQNLEAFSNFKLRASWGQLGNQNIAGYWPYLTVIDQNNDLSYSYNNSFAPGAAVTSLIDQNITWETSTTLDIGADIGLFGNKINIEADYFRKTTTDILVQLPIPLILGGLTAPFENVGEMYNNGFEFVINYNNRKFSPDQLGFNMGVNLTYVDNQVTKFRGGDSPDQLYLIREGYSYNTLYGYKSIGIYQTDAEAAEHMYANGFTPVAGNLKFEDVNGDGKMGFEDKQDLGNTIPKLTFGLSPNFKYKGFDLSILMQGIAGVNVYTQNPYTQFSWEQRTISTRWRDAWSPDNPDSENPSLKYNNSWDMSPSSYWVHQLSFLKMKNIQLGYAIPERLASRLGVQKIYVYANAQNVFTWVSKGYDGYDPERSTFNSGYSIYPTPRIISMGINLNF